MVLYMEPEIIEKYKNRFSSLEEILRESNFAGASNISTEIIRVSEFLDIPELVFIGEFFESLFDNLKEIDMLFDFDQEIKNELNTKILSSINIIRSSIPFEEPAIKATLFDNLVKLRSDVTKIQIKYGTLMKRKKEIPRLKELSKITEIIK